MKNRENFIVLEDVSFFYKENRLVLKNINLSFHRDEITAIIGPNGSGKTTLGKIMMGIISPTTGKAFIEGVETIDMTLGQIGKKIGYLFQNPERQLFCSTVLEEMIFPSVFSGQDMGIVESKAIKILKMFDLYHLKDFSPFKLSYGEKERLVLASILMNDVEYLVLDEPTVGLDEERKNILSNTINKLVQNGIGLTIISHDEEFVSKHASRIVELSRGEVVGDCKREV